MSTTPTTHSATQATSSRERRRGKVGRGAAVETERNPRPPLRSAEGHFVRRSRRPIDDRVAEGLREVPHHAVVDCILREGGHPCGHDRRVVAHANSLQISSPAAVDAEIAEARRALASGAELFIGGHGGAAGADAVRFKIDYLECVKRLLAANGTADEFAHALRAAYPELPGEAGLDALAQALYADR